MALRWLTLFPILLYIHVYTLYTYTLILIVHVSRGFPASGASPASAATGYIDGYSDGGHGSSGPMHYPSSNSPWSHKTLPHGGSKSQVRHLAILRQWDKCCMHVNACMSHVLWCICHFICICFSICICIMCMYIHVRTCMLMHMHAYSCTCT